MKTLYLVIDKTNQHIVGAYPDYDICELEVTSNALKNMYDIRNIWIRKIDEVDDAIYDRMITKFKPKYVWN